MHGHRQKTVYVWVTQCEVLLALLLINQLNEMAHGKGLLLQHRATQRACRRSREMVHGGFGRVLVGTTFPICHDPSDSPNTKFPDLRREPGYSTVIALRAARRQIQNIIVLRPCGLAVAKSEASCYSRTTHTSARYSL